MERMDGAQRQYGTFFLRPRLPMPPSEYNAQAVLADIFGGVPDAIRDTVTRDNFARLFAVPDPAAA